MKLNKASLIKIIKEEIENYTTNFTPLDNQEKDTLKHDPTYIRAKKLAIAVEQHHSEAVVGKDSDGKIKIKIFYLVYDTKTGETYTESVIVEPTVAAVKAVLGY